MKCTRERESVLRRNIRVEWKWKDDGLWWCSWKKVGEDEGVVLFFRLKYTFGPYFCQNYSIWFLFSLFVQFGHHFCKIVFNRVLLTNGVTI